MSNRENCEHRHTNGNCLFNGGFCLANDENHCVRINEIKSYNQALEDVLKLIATLGIDWEVKNSDIDWLEKSVERLRK